MSKRRDELMISERERANAEMSGRMNMSERTDNSAGDECACVRMCGVDDEYESTN